MEENFQYHGIDLYGSYLNYRNLIIAIFIINLIGIIFLISIIYIDELEELKENYEEYYNLSLAMVISGLVAVVLLLVGMFLIIKYNNNISMENNIINNILQITYAKSYRANLRNELATYLYNRIPESDKASHKIGNVNANDPNFKNNLADWLSGGGNSYDIGGQTVNRLGPVAQYGLVTTTGAPIPPPASSGQDQVTSSEQQLLAKIKQLEQQLNKNQNGYTERQFSSELSLLYDKIKEAFTAGDYDNANKYLGRAETICDIYTKQYPTLKPTCGVVLNEKYDQFKKKAVSNNQPGLTNLDSLPPPPPGLLIKPELSPEKLQAPPQALQPELTLQQKELLTNFQKISNFQKTSDFLNLKNPQLVTNKKNDLENKLFQKGTTPQSLTSQDLLDQKKQTSNRSSSISSEPIAKTSPPGIISKFSKFYTHVMRMNMNDIARESEYLKSQLNIYCNTVFGRYITNECNDINIKIQQSLRQPVLEDNSNYYDKAIGNNPPESLEELNQFLFTEDNLKSNPLVRTQIKEEYKTRCKGKKPQPQPCKEMNQKMNKYKIPFS